MTSNFPEARWEEPRHEDGGPNKHDKQRDEVVEVEAVVAVGIAHDLPHDGAHSRRRVLLRGHPDMMFAKFLAFISHVSTKSMETPFFWSDFWPFPLRAEVDVIFICPLQHSATSQPSIIYLRLI